MHTPRTYIAITVLALASVLMGPATFAALAPEAMPESFVESSTNTTGAPAPTPGAAAEAGTAGVATGTANPTINQQEDCVLQAFEGGDPYIYDNERPDPFLLPPCLKPDNAPGFAAEILGASDGSNLKLLISYVAGGIAALSGILAVVFIMFHGFNLTISGGDDGKREDSLKKLQWAILGLIGVIFAYVIVNVVLDIVIQVGTPPAIPADRLEPTTTQDIPAQIDVPVTPAAISGDRSA